MGQGGAYETDEALSVVAPALDASSKRDHKESNVWEASKSFQKLQPPSASFQASCQIKEKASHADRIFRNITPSLTYTLENILCEPSLTDDIKKIGTVVPVTGDGNCAYYVIMMGLLKLNVRPFTSITAMRQCVRQRAENISKEALW